MRDDLMRVHDAFHQLPDAWEGDFAIQESIDGDFVGGVEYGGQRAADGSGVMGEIDGGKVIHARCFEVQGTDLGEVERLEIVRHAVRPRDCVLNREAHVAVAELGDDAVVGELDHAVHDALRMDDNLDLLHRHVEEPLRLDHFEAFVEERGAVDGDLAAHVPGRMLQSLCDGDIRQLVGQQRAEGAAAGGEQDALHVAVAMALQALEDGVVLAVHGQDVHAFAFRSLGDGFACHDEDFLAGDGEVHASFDGCECWSESRRADDGDEHHVSIGFIDQIDESLRSGVQNDIRRQQCARFGSRSGIGERDLLHAGFADLFGEGFDTAVCGQADDLHALWDVARDFEGTGADGAGGAEEQNFTHHHEAWFGLSGDDGQVEIKHWRGEEQAIREIEDATDAGQRVAAVLDGDAAFQHRLREIACDGCDAEKRREDHAVQPSDGRDFFRNNEE